MVRFKARHILCEIVNKDGELQGSKIQENDLMSTLKTILKELHGDYGLSYAVRSSNLRVHYFNRNTNIVLIRCKRGFHKLVQSCLPFVKRVGSEDVMLRTLHLGGTIRSCNKFLIKHHRAKLPKLLQHCSSKEEKQEVKAMIKEISKECERKLGLLENFRSLPKS